MNARESRLHIPALRRALMAELSKVYSLPMTWITLGGTFMVNLLLALAFSNAALQGIVSINTTLEIGLASVSYPQAGFIVWGILMACSEYSGGQIRTTLTAMPQRGVQLIAAYLAMTLVLIPAAGMTSLAGLLVTQLLYGGAASTLVWADVVISLLGVTMYLTLTGLISAAIGMMTRRTIVAVSLVLGYYFIAGPLIRDYASFAKYLPDTAGVVLWFPPSDHALTPLEGGVLLVVWTFVAISIAAWLYTKRDM